MPAEPALRFWLQALASEGGIVATSDEPAFVLVPDRWQATFELPDEIMVTADPDVAREDGAVLVTAGQPLVTRAAEMVLDEGDAGWAHLAWPTLLPPSEEAFQALVRDRIVDGGDPEVDGQPAPVYVPMLRLGVVIRYVISLDDRFDENEEIWVDGRSGLCLPATIVRELGRATLRPGIGRDHRTLPPDIGRAVGEAHHRLDYRAASRRSWLADGVAAARQLELKRAEAHYEAALAVNAARSAAAPVSGQSLYAAQSNAIRAERSRRLLEIGQHPPTAHEIHPYRLHMVGIPALRVPVVIRRGTQRFSFSLDWLLPLSTFGPVACPHCQAGEPLVAARGSLGCRRCLTPAPVRPTSVPEATRTAPGRNGHPVDPLLVAPPPVEAHPVRRPSRPSPIDPNPADLAVEFWEAVVASRRWPRRSTAPSSPLEVLIRLYGDEGPLRAVGMPAGQRPNRVTNTTTGLSPVDRVSSGLLGAGEMSLPYTLRWRLADDRPMVSEVLPYPSLADRSGSPLPPLDGLDLVARSWLTEAAPRPPSLGPVEEQIWKRVSADGMPFVIRCLAVWRRLEMRARLADVDPAVLAASVAVVGAEHSGIETTVRAEAERHGVSDFAVGHVSRQLNTLVGRMSSPLW